MDEKEPWEIEAEGHKKGLNPMMGVFTRRFSLLPIPYGNSKREEFVAEIRAQLGDVHYVFTGSVKLEITLFFDEQTRLETSRTADLDNYAKLMCDALKGSEGLLIDDSQIQCLTISWIDTLDSPCFEIEVDGDPDEFAMKPVVLYEMSDGLFYPFPGLTKVEEKQLKTRSTQSEQATLLDLFSMLDRMVQRVHKIRHAQRESGLDSQGAYFKALPLSPLIQGFHKSRVVESGFPLVYKTEWKETLIHDPSR